MGFNWRQVSQIHQLKRNQSKQPLQPNNSGKDPNRLTLEMYPPIKTYQEFYIMGYVEAS